MEEEHYQETARENNVEMDIDIQHTDPGCIFKEIKIISD